VEIFHIRLVEVDLRDRRGDLRERQYPELLPLQEQALDFFEFLQINDLHQVLCSGPVRA
jgi:hypothetical protein